MTAGHGAFPDGTRFLVVEQWAKGWLLGWRDGVEPAHTGTLLREDLVRREANE